MSISISGLGTYSITNSTISTSVNYSLNTKPFNVDNDGYFVVDKLTLLDEITGRRWLVKISNGQLLVEPVELIDKRDYKIEQVLK